MISQGVKLTIVARPYFSFSPPRDNEKLGLASQTNALLEYESLVQNNPMLVYMYVLQYIVSITMHMYMSTCRLTI